MTSTSAQRGRRTLLLILVFAGLPLRLAQAVIDNAWNPLDINYTPQHLAARIIEVPRAILAFVCIVWFCWIALNWMVRWAVQRNHA